MFPSNSSSNGGTERFVVFVTFFAGHAMKEDEQQEIQESGHAYQNVRKHIESGLITSLENKGQHLGKPTEH